MNINQSNGTLEMKPMTDGISYSDFSQEIECSFKEERYSVRDNGAVLRHPRVNKRPRKGDNQWTFGNANFKTGYMEIASVRVHRIVATAFHGTPPTKEHVVDHIDTNKQNNRPENLRWVTRLENILLNPITVKRIELACGCSIEEFLAEPSKFRGKFLEPNYEWMCTVSKQEAQSSLERMLSWARSDQRPSGGKLGEWIYNRNKTADKTIATEYFKSSIDKIFERVEKEKGVNKIQLSSKSKNHKNLDARIYAAKLLRSEIGLSDEQISQLVGRSPSMVNTYLRWQEDRREHIGNATTNVSLFNTTLSQKKLLETVKSLTPNAVQRDWRISSEFPCCPRECGEEPIKTYAANLIAGSLFCQNGSYSTLVSKSAISSDEQTLYVMTESSEKENAVKPWALARITYENNLFVHTSLGTFFEQVGADKQFCLALGLEWKGGDSIDDYC